MSYGLRIYSQYDTINPIFDSINAFGFIELSSMSVGTTGSAGATLTFTVDDGYSDIFYTYTPENISVVTATPPTLSGVDSTNTRVPHFDRGAVTDNGDGTKTFRLILTWTGQTGNTSTNRIGGGRVLVFGR